MFVFIYFLYRMFTISFHQLQELRQCNLRAQNHLYGFKTIRDPDEELRIKQPFRSPSRLDNHLDIECNRIISTSHRHSITDITVFTLRFSYCVCPPLADYSIIQGEFRRDLFSAYYLQNNRLYFI